MYPLIVKNLRKEFVVKTAGRKKVQVAVSDLSFHIRSGEVVGLLGPNGAGKSTTIFMLLGVLGLTSGKVEYFGRDLIREKSQIMSKVGYISGYAKLPGTLTVTENLEWTGALYGIDRVTRVKRIAELIERFDLGEQAHKKAAALSAGQTTRVMLAKAFLHKPELVLLDEPTASLDPEIAHEVRRFVLEHAREQKVSMLFTSHNMDEVTAVCDRVIFLSKGTILAEGTPRELAALADETRLELAITQGFSQAISLADELGTVMVADEASGKLLLTLHHLQVGPFVSRLGRQGVAVRDLEMKKPTLEDFFIQVATDGLVRRQSSEKQELRVKQYAAG